MPRGTLDVIVNKPRIPAAATPPRPPTTYDRLQGIAAALGALAREYMEPDLGGI
jgi:hypothetical protein